MKWQTYIRWAEWLLCVAAMAYLVYRLATYDAYHSIGFSLQQMNSQRWIVLLVAFVLIPVQLHVEAYRWKSLIRGWKNVSIGQSWSQVLTGMLAGFITPYRAGDIPARLVAAGLDIDKEKLALRWHDWLHDWTKWLAVAGWTIVRYVVWGVQLWIVLDVVGVEMTWLQAIESIAVYYVMISIMPILPAADVALKGGWAILIFGQYSDNVAAIMIAVSIIWIFNTIIPVFFGGIKKMLYLCKQ